MVKESIGFIKWAGGKKQLIPQFKSILPKKIDRYFEPFVGGGAMAFYIIKQYKPKEVFLSDINNEVVNAYNIIKNNVEQLIIQLRKLKKNHNKKNHNKKNYYKMRAQNPNILTPCMMAARFIYLNKTCFNGLYRVNSKGGFNVPMGGYTNPGICQEDELREIAQLLKNVTIKNMQFYDIEKNVKKNDFVYCDPPYYPIKKNSFTTYTKDNFLDDEQIRLKELFDALNKKGAKIMLSNSNAPFIKKLYSKYKRQTVNAKRMINSNAKNRGAIKELVVTNY